jgi:deoxycytidine triphosphate deaminase
LILSDHEIRKAIENKVITIYPQPDEKQYSTSAIDFLVGEEFFKS